MRQRGSGRKRRLGLKIKAEKAAARIWRKEDVLEARASEKAKMMPEKADRAIRNERLAHVHKMPRKSGI